MIGMTIITISRAIRRFKDEIIEIDYSPITDPSKAVITTLDEKVLKRVIKEMKLPRLKINDLTREDFKIFASSGPDGVSSKTALQTLSRMSLKTVEQITTLTGPLGRSHILELALKLCGPFIMKRLDPEFFAGRKLLYKGDKDHKPIYMKCDNTPRNDLRARRLAVVEDPELKLRIVAKFDHFSQQILSKLSDSLFRMLRMIPSDRTFTQDP